MKLSVLDQSPIRSGGTAREAVMATVELAKAADRLGYTRYWLAEHHNSPTLADASPEVLIPYVAAHTSSMRVGSGGVMLTHYSSLKVAETFRMLETLHPGRIDMGLGRAPGSDRRTAAALQHGMEPFPVEYYPHQVADVIRYMTGEFPPEHPFEGIRAMPAGPGMPMPWLLGSSGDSAMFAARMGLPFSFAHFINPDTGPETVQSYRNAFEPSPWFAEPVVNVGVAAICAPTSEEAVRLGMSRHLMRLRRDQGRPLDGVPSAEQALNTDYTLAEQNYIRYQQSRAIEGDPDRVKSLLTALADEYGVDELVIVTITHDYADRLRSYELLAEAFCLEAA